MKGESADTRSLDPLIPRSLPLAISMGDPAGIGPEIILKSLSHMLRLRWLTSRASRMSPVGSAFSRWVAPGGTAAVLPSPASKRA